MDNNNYEELKGSAKTFLQAVTSDNLYYGLFLLAEENQHSYQLFKRLSESVPHYYHRDEDLQPVGDPFRIYQPDTDVLVSDRSGAGLCVPGGAEQYRPWVYSLYF